MTALVEFLYPAPARRRVGSIVGWWERRRLAYNAIVGGAGLFSMGFLGVVSHLPPGPHRMGIPAAAILVVGIAANVCYCLGPAVEVAVQKLWGAKVLPVGPALYRMGLTFSVGLVLLPTLLASFDWVFRVVRAIL
jgi:hypothetical protein